MFLYNYVVAETWGASLKGAEETCWVASMTEECLIYFGNWGASLYGFFFWVIWNASLHGFALLAASEDGDSCCEAKLAGYEAGGGV